MKDVRSDSNGSTSTSVFPRDNAGFFFYVYVYIFVYLCTSISVYQYILQAYVRIVTVPPVQVCSLEMLLALWVCS